MGGGALRLEPRRHQLNKPRRDLLSWCYVIGQLGYTFVISKSTDLGIAESSVWQGIRNFLSIFVLNGYAGMLE